MNNAEVHGCPYPGWVCFHCGEEFRTVGGAADHFGSTPDRKAACQIKLGDERGLVMALREAEREAEAWRIAGEAMEAARDALAAHVERLRGLIVRCTPKSQEAWFDVTRALAETPTTSLARLKAQWQAEALEEVLALTEGCDAAGIANALRCGAAHLRNQARKLSRPAEEGCS